MHLTANGELLPVPPRQKVLPTKTILIMKWMAIFLFAACLQTSAEGRAQTFTLSMKNAPLPAVFEQIKKQSGYQFFFNESMLQNGRTVTIDIKSGSLQDVLEKCFHDQPFTYIVLGKTIVVKERERPEKPSPSPNVQAAPIPAPPDEIRGIVVDSLGRPLSGASVMVKGSARGTQTDARGLFVLQESGEKVTLLISYSGYESREYTWQKSSGNNLLNIRLRLSSDPLDQVQIIAYGTTTQRYNVGSVSTVTAKDIEQQPVTNPLEALQGRVPGLVVNVTNGAPGAMVTTQVRGQNTLMPALTTNLLSAYNQPLFIIDGVPFAPPASANYAALGTIGSLAMGANPGLTTANYYGGMSPLNSINPLDIESISVLKDADATSIYGSQGSNGVILITTKRGKSGKTQFNLSVNSGPTRDTRIVKMMNTPQYLAMRNEALRNDGLTPSIAHLDYDLLLFDTTKNTNWYNQFFGGTAAHTDVHASVSGGTQNTNFLLSGGLTHTGYNFPGGFADQRLSLHSSFSHKSLDQRFSLDFGTDYSYDQNNSTGSNSLQSILALPPDFPDFRDANGNLLWSYKGVRYASMGLYGSGIPNPYAFLKQTSNYQVYDVLTHALMSYQIGFGLKFIVAGGYNRVDNQGYGTYPMAATDPAAKSLGSASRSSQTSQMLNLDPQLNFTQKIANGQLTAVVGGSYKKSLTSGSTVSGSGYTSDAVLGSIAAAPNRQVYDNFSEYKYVAGFARLNYIWDRKYIVDFTGNRNGSSNFGPGNRFGNFGSAGAGWIFTEESFAKNVLPVLSFGKLSASYGTSGSDGVSSYQYQPNWSASTNYGSFAYQGFTGFYPKNLYNPNYSWASTKKFNGQLELGFLHDRIYVDVQRYVDRSSNQLAQFPLPLQTGFTSITQNAPYTVQNSGWELTLRTRNVDTKNFKWTSTFNIAWNRNKLVAFPGLATSVYKSLYAVGKSISARPVVDYAGVNDTTGSFQFRNAKGQLTYTPNSTPSYNNLGGDATKMADLQPSFTGGFNNDLSYKGFHLTLFFQFAKQTGLNYLFSVYSSSTYAPPGGALTNVPTALLGRWQKPGDKSDIQRFTTGNGADRTPVTAAAYFVNSSGDYADASYIRLKTAALSYSLPADWIKKMRLQGCMVYMNVQNLFTITGYKVGDPETQNLYNIPPQRTFVAGINLNF